MLPCLASSTQAANRKKISAYVGSAILADAASLRKQIMMIQIVNGLFFHPRLFERDSQIEGIHCEAAIERLQVNITAEVIGLFVTL